MISNFLPLITALSAASPPKKVRKQNIYFINAQAAVEIIDLWLAREPFYLWGLSPEFVKQRILDLANERGEIPYLRASGLLVAAETYKMPSCANRGMQFIRQEWQKIYLPLVDQN